MAYVWSGIKIMIKVYGVSVVMKLGRSVKPLVAVIGCIVLLVAASISTPGKKNAYMFAQGGKKERAKQKAIEEPHPSPPTAVTAPAQEEPIIITPPVERPVPVRKPVPEDQQREIFKWILEEKRKAKPQNRQEKKRIDEEKAILKEFIRAESLPKI
ncbi:uncharacterized protein LOC131004904 isoform X1 [Salvia miltiorrhiza]|uniref:uncharacterized protein LOC130986447 isoform X1 n=1 Tax=Salvia miltiorrhiza TaxID=226208 RepID=UPI0025AB6F00|nr:uncharacterized protein LOC130986447 isoform X1 [Salvia miltiorrhiza]XP_057787652.1 uncharacterized protein LOC131004904 isoform X1 [Salvia miltiorrhiza]